MSKFHPIAVVLFATALSAQTTWIVDPSGGGNFTSLASAHAAATAGDTLILVGTMPGATITKRLNIVAHGATVTTALSILATGDVSVSGGDFDGGITSGSGPVSLDGVSTTLTVGFGGTASARACEFDGDGAPFAPAASIAANAHALFDECTFRGTDAIIMGVPFPVAGTAGLRCDGYAELRACSVDGGSPTPHPWLGQISGGPAIDLGATFAQAQVDLKDCHLSSGAPFDRLHGTGSVRAENTVTGTHAATISVVNANLPWMTGTSSFPGGSLAINVDSTATTLATISVSLGVQAPVSTPIGDIWLSPAYIPLTAGVTDINGELTTTIGIPASITRGLTLTFQGVVFPATGGIEATTPAILHVL